jgi:DNA-binding MarR family transcriptional regulator
MPTTQRTPAGAALSDFVLDLFGLTNRMLTAGDRLVAGLGLTSARWQVLGSIAAADRPQPVAWLARDMGANRQNIQRIVNDLAAEGMVTFQTNPHHRRAQLIVLTEKGRQTLHDAMRLQTPWINKLSDGIQLEDLAATQRVIAVLRHRLEGVADADE